LRVILVAAALTLAAILVLPSLLSEIGASDAAKVPGPAGHQFQADLSPAAIQAYCRAQDDRKGCYLHALDHLMRVEGMERAIRLVDELAALDPVVRAGGHDYIHEVGRLAYFQFGDPRAAMATCTDAYQSGCYHGVLESYLGNQQDGVTPDDLRGVCEPIGGEPQSLFRRHQCIHGMGHGITIYFAHDVFTAVKYCDALPTEWDQRSCYTGAFMENGVAVGATHSHAKPPPGATLGPMYKKDDLLYPCNAVDDRYRWACYYLQTSLMLRLNGVDLAGMMRACDAAGVPYAAVCYQSAGRDVSALSGQQVDTALRNCRLGTREYWPECYTGVLKDIAWSSEEPGYAICQKVEGEFRERCAQSLGEVIGTLYPDAVRRAERCERLEGGLRDACRRGAGIG
jgi:hypothetical protein